MENPAARNLRRDQEGRHDGGDADQPQKLIHRKHAVPQDCLNVAKRQIARMVQQPVSIRSLRDLLTRELLVSVSCSSNRDQRQNGNNG